MLIDTNRIEDFLETHSCHIVNKGEDLEDNVTYADFVTNRYETMQELKQKQLLQKEITNLKLRSRS